jgi:hypothetical protein
MLMKELNRRLGQAMLMITGDFERDRLWRQDCPMRDGCIV